MSLVDTTFYTNGIVSPTATIDGNLPVVLNRRMRCRWHTRSRRGTGPTGRKPIWVIADVCTGCGMIVETFGALSWQAADWVRRWNRRVEADLAEMEHGTREL